MAPPFPSLTTTWHTSTYPAISPLRPELSLAGKTVVLTGGGTGIGFEIAKSIVLASASHLILLSRRPNVLSAAKAALQAVNSNTKIITIPADISDQDSIDAAFSQIKQELAERSLDILVSNAAFFTGTKPLGTETVDEWQTMFNINIKGVYLLTRAFIALAPKTATIINISTAAVHLPPFSGFSSYGVTKLAGSKLMQYVQAANPQLTVIDLHPGQVTETEMAQKYTKLPDGLEENLKIQAFEGHIDDAELAGNFTVWLTSPEASFLKGKFVWTNWDVEELKQKAEEIKNSSLLTLTLDGFSSF